MFSVKKNIAYFIVIFLLCAFMYADESDDANNLKKLKAGFFAFDGYHKISADNVKSGYGYDFLQLLSRYSNMNFECVGYERSWNDMLKMLSDGEIDLVTSARKTPEREVSFDFSLPIGTSCVILNVRSDEERFISGKYSSYNGMKIGLLVGNSKNNDFFDFAARRHFSYKTFYFETDEELSHALRNKEIDAVVTGSLRRADFEKTLDSFAQENFYVIVKKGNKELLEEINYAISQMDYVEGDWRDSLYYEYFGKKNDDRLIFTEREKQVIKKYSSEKKLVVSVNCDKEPYAFIQNGKITGILPDIFERYMKDAGFDFEYYIPLSSEDYEEKIKNGTIQLQIDCSYQNSADLDDSRIYTPSFFIMNGASVTKKAFKGPVKKVAVIEERQSNHVAELKEDSENSIEYYVVKNRNQVVDAVRKGNADKAYVYVYTAERLLNADMSGQLVYKNLSEPFFYCAMSVPSSMEHEIISVLTKCIHNLPQTEIDEIVDKYLNYSIGNVTFWNYLISHPVVFIFLILIVVSFISIIIVVTMGSAMSRKLLAKEQETVKQQEALQSQLSIALERAEQTSKAKTAFLSNMSHDIRTPMNAIIGFTRLGLKYTDDDLMRGYLEKTMVSSQHLLSLINDVLDMSRIESGKIKIEEIECNLSELLHDINTIVVGQTEAKSQKFCINTENIMNENVYCDKLRLHQVLLNLISNAVKFTPSGGNIRVLLKQIPSSSKIYGNYEIRVKDDGIGISKDFMKKIFQPFERDKSPSVSKIQGTGLGLSITKKIITMMGGTIDVKSEENQGCEFIINLQLKLQNRQLAIEPISELKDKRVLIVDEDFQSCDAIGQMLMQLGLRSEWTLNGKEAVLKAKQAENMENPFDFFIISWQLSDLNGIEVIRQIRAFINKDIPVYIMTSYDWTEIESEAYEVGVTSFFSKPIFVSELRKKLISSLSGESGEDIKIIPVQAQINFSGRRLLLVEDNEMNREIAVDILEEYGIEVETAEDGSIAVEMVQKSEPGYYNAVLMDVQMPVMDGYEATRKIRNLENKRNANVPIIAMTANAFEEDKRNSIDAGMNAHLSKPIDINKLNEVLDRIL